MIRLLESAVLLPMYIGSAIAVQLLLKIDGIKADTPLEKLELQVLLMSRILWCFLGGFAISCFAFVILDVIK